MDVLEWLRKDAEEREAFSAKLANGEMPTREALQVQEDEATVARWEGHDVSPANMGNAGLNIQQARARVAARKAAKADPDGARKDADGLRLIRSLFGG